MLQSLCHTQCLASFTPKFTLCYKSLNLKAIFKALHNKCSRPIQYFSVAYILIYYFCVVIPAGTEAHETLFLINNEPLPFQFNIKEDSCHTDGFSSKVIVSPMEGVIPGNGRLVYLQIFQKIFFFFLVNEIAEYREVTFSSFLHGTGFIFVGDWLV